MAITGKIWSAVLKRVWHSATDSTTVLYYGLNDLTSAAQIASLYPSLSWDEAVGVDNGILRHYYLPQCYPTPSAAGLYSTDEEAILDLQNYFETTTAGGRGGVAQFYDAGFKIRYRDGLWLTESFATGYVGSPESWWANFPDANTYNITTAAPFGSGLGNGLIRHQAVYYPLDINADPNFGELVGAQFPDPPSPLVEDTGNIRLAWIDITYIFTPLDDGTGGTDVDGVGDGQLPTDDITIRCWGFSLDGHDFYVLRLGDSATFVYDLTTGTWSEWASPGRTNWRAHVGQNWVGVGESGFFDTDVIAGDDASGTVWRLDTAFGRDQRSDTSTLADDKFNRVVVGGIQVTGRDVIPCNAITLDLALGDPTQTGASIQLEISDDLGETWTDCGAQEIVANDFTATVEWRGLGIIRAPGRLFRFTDDGATVEFKGANLR